jgi:hypothetical protein
MSNEGLHITNNMKTKKAIHAKSIRPLLLMAPVICSMAFAACSDVDGTAGMRNTALFIRDVNSTKRKLPMPAPGLSSNPRPPAEPYDLHAAAYDR